jgi:hypothetical protein
MPGLREQVVLIICQEWPKQEIELNPATISERLQSAGYSSATEAEVRLELEHLAQHRNIKLAWEPGGTDVPTVAAVHPELCLEPRS